MSNVLEIEDAVKGLGRGDLAKFRDWFAEFDFDAWDRQIEEDAAAGRLDALLAEANADILSGRCESL